MQDKADFGILNAMLEQIKASAGSGKTYTLTRRFLAHLAKASPDATSPACATHGASPIGAAAAMGSYPPSGILAATFTNKAAAEMQARVIRELKSRALSRGAAADADFPLTPEQSRHWVGVFLRHLDALNIRTIDSLLTLLVRLNALALSLPPDFTPVFSPQETLTPLYDAMLDQAANGDAEVQKALRGACAGLLRHGRSAGFMAGRALRARLLEVIQLFLQGTPLPPPETEDAAASILAAMHRDLTQSAAALAGFVQDEELRLIAYAAKFLERCQNCRPLEILRESEFGNKTDFDDWQTKISKGRASEDARAAHRDLLIAYTALVTHGPALLAAMDILPFVNLARPLTEALEAIQREEGLVPAARLPVLALRALGADNGVSDAFCRMGDTLTHLLFDEFQDTSTDQWRSILPLAVNCLSQGGSLTYVGDVKQAIYGWRGGNAELFDAVAANPELTAMLEKGPARNTLASNWRSAPAIVAFNNALFGRLADPEQATAVLAAMLPANTPPHLAQKARLDLCAAFADCEQAVPDKNAANPGLVRLTRIAAPSGAELAESVREKLRGLLLDDLLLRRPPGDIAVLVRKNSDAASIAGWLAEWGVPVVTDHSFCLGAHPLIARLVDTLAFLEYPLDDAAFWSCVSGPELFGPLFGPGEAALTDWLARVRSDAATAGEPLFMAYRRDFPESWTASLGPFLDQAGLMSAYDTVLELTRHFRLHERFPEQAPFLRRFAEVAFAAENAGHSSLSSFLDYWTENGKDERVPMPESMDAVRICSMHKAKGLEFPVVIVPYHHQADPADAPLVRAEVLGLPLITYRTRHLGDPYYEALLRNAGERLNLLYVAWTRPVEELHAFITETGRSVYSSALAKALAVLLRDLPFIDGVYESGTPPPPSITGSRELSSLAGAGRSPALVEPLPPSSPQRPMGWLPRLKIFRNPAEDRGFSERRRGLLAHAGLEALQLTASGPAVDAERAVRHAMRVFPLPLPDPEAVQRDMTAMLTWYAALPEALNWIRHGRAEQSLLDDEGALHRVDLLVDEPGSPLLAVEYKTGQPDAQHKAQVARYLGLLAAACPGRQVQGVIVYLDGRTLMPVAYEHKAGSA